MIAGVYPFAIRGITEIPYNSAYNIPMKGNLQLFIGTSGYSYKDWVGPVYPHGTAQNRYLEEYQKNFSFTEINSSYYHIPGPELSNSLVRRSSDHFRFTIKAHQSFTHPGSPAGGKHGQDDGGGKTGEWRIHAEFTRNLQKYLHGIAPLAHSGKLLGVLAQFPFSFHYTGANRQFLADAIGLFQERAQSIMDAPRLFLEFRGSEWDKPSVYQGLNQFQAAPVFPDTPPLEGLPGLLSVDTWKEQRRRATSDCPTAAVRLHGRNSANWWHGTNVSRYDYLYSSPEIRDISNTVRRIGESLSGEQKILIISFNNHHRGQAVQNARELAKTLDLIDPESPGVS